MSTDSVVIASQYMTTISVALGLAIMIVTLIFVVKDLNKRAVSSYNNPSFNKLAVILFILMFIVSPLLVGFFQYISLKQIKTTDERGSGLAKFSIFWAWLQASFLISGAIVVTIALVFSDIYLPK